MNDGESFTTYAELFAYLKSQGRDIKTPDEEDAEIRERIKNGTITVNQLRIQRGRSPLPGGDVPVRDFKGWGITQDVGISPKPTQQTEPPCTTVVPELE